jgi:hypothetical protein
MLYERPMCGVAAFATLTRQNRKEIIWETCKHRSEMQLSYFNSKSSTSFHSYSEISNAAFIEGYQTVFN